LSDAVSLRPVLFGGFRKTQGLHRCEQRRNASRGVRLPFRVFRLRSARTRIGLGAPLMPFATRAGLQGHHDLRHRSRCRLQSSSLGLSRSFRVPPRVERPPDCPEQVRTAAPPVRFLPLQRFPVESSGSSCLGVPRTRRHASSGFLNLLTPSSASDLPALFQTGSALGVLPSEPSSSRAAVRRLRRRCPPVVRNHRADATVGVVAGAKDSAPILLQQAPPRSSPPSGLCSARESATSTGGLDPYQHVALLGFIPSRVFPPTAMARPSPRLPSCGYRLPAQGSSPTHFRVSLDGGIGWSPEGDCRPSWGFGPHDSSRVFGHAQVLESPPQESECVTTSPALRLQTLCRTLPEPPVKCLSARPLDAWGFLPLQRTKRGQRPAPGLPPPTVQRLRSFSDP
jgi:hypothetical protein